MTIVAIGVVWDEALADVTSFVTSEGSNMDYTIAFDQNDATSNGATATAYGVSWIPQSFIVGTDGKILWWGNSADLADPLAAAVATLQAPNDDFSDAISISGTAGQTTGKNIFATRQSGEPTIAGNAGGASVWWKWTAPGSSNVSFNTHGSGFDTLLGVYTGTSVNSLTLVAGNDNDGTTGNVSGVSFSAQKGTTYMIAVDGHDGATGNITLNWSSAPTQYSLTVAISPQASGTVTLAPTGGNYASGTSVTLTASGKTGYAFDHWEQDLTGSTNPATISMTANKRVTAVFVPAFVLTTAVSPTNSGTVALNPPGGSYVSGANVGLTASPKTGYVFDHWEGGVTGTTNPTTIAMTSDKTVTAVFVPALVLTVTVLPAGSGKVTLNPPGGSYLSGTNIGLTPVANAGYVFDHWEQDLSGAANPAEIAMTANKNVTAVFKGLYSLTVTVSPANSGSVTLSSPAPYLGGSNVSLTPVANAGYVFDHWERDLTGAANPATITMNANTNITAVFKALYTVTVIVSPADSGTVTLNPAAGPYVDGTSISLTPAANTGYVFDHWEHDLIGTANPATMTADANKNVTAVFKPSYTVTTSVSPADSGNVVRNPAGNSYAAGTSLSLTAAAKTGFTFDHWEQDLAGSTNPATITVDANKNVTAVFKPVYALTAVVSPAGSGTVTLNPAGGSYAMGTSVSLAPVANAECVFDHWEQDLTGVANPATLAMSSNKSVTAVFKQKVYALNVAVFPANVGTVALNPPAGSYPSKTSVTLTPVANAGYQFDHWVGDVSGTANPGGITIRAEANVTAIFVEVRKVAVPNLAAMTQPQAQAALSVVSLVVGTVTRQASATVPSGSVMGQNPAAGTMAAPGAAVDLILSEGNAPVAVPNVVGMAENDAFSALENAALVAGAITMQSSATISAGKVAAQYPGSGVSIPAGAAVNLVVSTGPLMASVPDVTGMTQAAAQATLTTAGLIIGQITSQHSDSVLAGNVISQNPGHGTPVVAGSAIDLLISDGRAPAVVPGVVGNTQADARAAITSAGFALGTTAQRQSATIAAGIVIGQDPSANISVALGSAINLIVSSGPPPQPAPSVAGMTQSDALAHIASAGLVVGTITQQASDTVPAGQVISQDPPAGTNIAAGTCVNLVISGGAQSVGCIGATMANQSFGGPSGGHSGDLLVLGTVMSALVVARRRVVLL